MILSFLTFQHPLPFFLRMKKEDKECETFLDEKRIKLKDQLFQVMKYRETRRNFVPISLDESLQFPLTLSLYSTKNMLVINDYHISYPIIIGVFK